MAQWGDNEASASLLPSDGLRSQHDDPNTRGESDHASRRQRSALHEQKTRRCGGAISQSDSLCSQVMLRLLRLIIGFVAVCALMIFAGSRPADDQDDPLPVPTEAQYRWHKDEMGAIIHFNMGTFADCSIGLSGRNSAGAPIVPSPETFNPSTRNGSAVDTEGWLLSLKAAGVKRAVLVVSHGCGFLTFQPKPIDIGENSLFNYSYSVASSPYLGGKGDIVAQFVKSCYKHGIRPGFYFGLMNNAFLNVVGGKIQTGKACAWCPDLTNEQYGRVALANLRQLWSSYGPVHEVWFDGGVPASISEKVAGLLAELQPDAVAFQLKIPNGLRWVGTESGHDPRDLWMTTDDPTKPGAGDPHGKLWGPPESDTCFQQNCKEEGQSLSGPREGCWFYNSDTFCAPKLPWLQQKYHNTVGRSSLLLLGMTPTQEGAIDTNHVQSWHVFGKWVQDTYGTKALVSQPFKDKLSGSLVVSQPTNIGRIVVGEDVRKGQRIRSFMISVDGKKVFEAKTIGHKRIVVLPKPVTVHSNITMEVLSLARETKLPVISLFEARL